MKGSFLVKWDNALHGLNKQVYLKLLHIFSLYFLKFVESSILLSKWRCHDQICFRKGHKYLGKSISLFCNVILFVEKKTLTMTKGKDDAMYCCLCMFDWNSFEHNFLRMPPWPSPLFCIFKLAESDTIHMKYFHFMRVCKTFPPLTVSCF